MQKYYNFASPVGDLLLGEENNELTLLAFNKERREEGSAPSSFLQEVEKQLTEYFAGKRREFDLVLKPPGTDFQKRVWQELLTVPYGETISYKEIAEQIGSPKAYRAVGLANNRNPLAIIIPCHRVIGTDGTLVGYGGGLKVKRFLLDLEKRHAL